MEYALCRATAKDKEKIYALFSESIRPYVEKIWGWDEEFQRKDFEESFSAFEQYEIIEMKGAFAGFVQTITHDECLEICEIHLLPEFRGKGLGSEILQTLLKRAEKKRRCVRIGCFKENVRAKALYLRMGFAIAEETETHYLLEKQFDSEKMR